MKRLTYRDGIRAAAEFAGQWDGQIASAFSMEDIILAKFNMLPKSKMRRKRTMLIQPMDGTRILLRRKIGGVRP